MQKANVIIRRPGFLWGYVYARVEEGGVFWRVSREQATSLTREGAKKLLCALKAEHKGLKIVKVSS